MILNNYYRKNNNETNQQLKLLIDSLYNNKKLCKEEFLFILNHINEELFSYLQAKACLKRNEIYQDSVFIRGLIEISNYCIQDCYYCGIRLSNKNVERYRYDKETILRIVADAYQKSYKTIVLQGGEDSYYTDEILVSIIKEIKEKYPDLVITLSLGERTLESYQELYDAGASRYLLRHESASERHYQKLHPEKMSLQKRKECLTNLKVIGFQTGAGLMVGSPFQTNEDLVEDLLFLQEFQPEMIGVGPFLKHHETPFKDESNGDLNHVLVIYALARLIVPNALIPSTTATSSLAKDGRLKALKSGCNVIMINLSDFDKRKNYQLYENKVYQGDESDEYRELIRSDINKANLIMDFSQGNYRRKDERNGNIY